MKRILGLTSAVVLLVQLPFTHANSWRYFERAVQLLVGSAGPEGSQGLHLYAQHPEFQFGPLSIVVAAPLVALGRPVGSLVAMVALSAVGVWCAVTVVRVAARLRPDTDQRLLRRSGMVAGVVFVVVWGDVAVRTAHIDDAIALAATVVALDAVSRRQAWVAAVALGVAGAAKPWAVVFAPMVLASGGGLLPLALSAAIVLASWLPFVIVEPATLDAARHGITNEASSALRALGFDDALTPHWVRPAQLGLGLAASSFLVLRGRWIQVVMVGVAIRLLLDPAANRYYTVGLVLGLMVHELTMRPEQLPWLTIGAALALEIPQAEGFPPTIAAWLRVAVVAAVVVEAARVCLHDRDQHAFLTAESMPVDRD